MSICPGLNNAYADGPRVFDSLSYYSEHQGEIESYIAKNKISEDLASITLK